MFFLQPWPVKLPEGDFKTKLPRWVHCWCWVACTPWYSSSSNMSPVAAQLVLIDVPLVWIRVSPLLLAVTPSWGSSNSPDPLLLSIVIYCYLLLSIVYYHNLPPILEMGFPADQKSTKLHGPVGRVTRPPEIHPSFWPSLCRGHCANHQAMDWCGEKWSKNGSRISDIGVWQFLLKKKHGFVGTSKHQNTASHSHWPGALDPPSRQQMHPQLLGGSKLRESVSKWGIPEITMTFGQLMVSYNKSQIVLVWNSGMWWIHSHWRSVLRSSLPLRGMELLKHGANLSTQKGDRP